MGKSMGDVGLWVLGVLWAAWVVAAVIAAAQVSSFAGRLKRSPHRHPEYRPRAWAILPVKGIGDDPAAAVRGLFEQDYPDYRLIFVVESQDDPAYAAVRAELGKHPQRSAEVLVSGEADANQGQKVHNQLAALRHIDQASRDEDVWVFADSDAAPDAEWLAHLIGPLSQQDRCGATSGYRWLVPAGNGASRPSVWSQLASVLNSSVACLQGKGRYSFAWGGSMAIRVGTARRGDLVKRLTGALTDDYPMWRLCRDLGLNVSFVPQCLVATAAKFSLFGESGLINFAHRQYLITRVYVPRLYAFGLSVTTLYVVGMVTSWAYLLTHVTGAAAWWQWSTPATAILAVAAANQWRAAARRRAVMAAFEKDVTDRLQTALRWDRWGAWLWMPLHWLLMLRAAVGRKMTWRGIRYRLDGPNRIRRL